ncbi:HAD hydrolase-like protein [Sphaerisporangium sp. NPDC049003]
MVGDSLVKDVGGGRAAGLRTVWVNPDGLVADGAQADHEAKHVTEAVTLLARLD